MSDHDPLCPGTGPTAPFPFPICVCAIIEQARADERERIARAIEEWPPEDGESVTEYREEWPPEDGESVTEYRDDMPWVPQHIAARIARGEMR